MIFDLLDWHGKEPNSIGVLRGDFNIDKIWAFLQKEDPFHLIIQIYVL
jgi:hypothetical protein